MDSSPCFCYLELLTDHNGPHGGLLRWAGIEVRPAHERPVGNGSSVIRMSLKIRSHVVKGVMIPCQILGDVQ